MFLEPISDEILTSESSAWDAQFFQDIFGFIGQIQVVDGKQNEKEKFFKCEE